MQRLVAEHSPLHVIGNTWLRFGRFDAMASHLRDSVTRYGRRFEDVFRGVRPQPKWHSEHKRWVDFRSITEAQLRLSVWATGSTLLEVPAPFLVSGNPLKSTRRPAVFLLRFTHVKQSQLCGCSRGATKVLAQLAPPVNTQNGSWMARVAVKMVKFFKSNS